jgi:hypothetical protein
MITEETNLDVYDNRRKEALIVTTMFMVRN